MSRSFPLRPGEILVLSDQDVARVLKPRLCLGALRDAYARLHADPAAAPRSVGFDAPEGSIHVKAGLSPGDRGVFAAKINANVPANRTRGLPTIQGLVVLFDAVTGSPAALIDSGELTARRTAAATALAADFGARPQSGVAAFVGCGRQAPHQLEALVEVRPLREVRAFDLEPERARAFARLAAERHGVTATAAPDPRSAAAGADLVVTCTTSAEPVDEAGWIARGTFVAAVGADHPKKHEIDPALFGRAAVIVDDLEACATGGDLAHALRLGVLGREDVRAGLADLAAGAAVARRSPEEIVLYDSVGTGVQDVAAAQALVAAALAEGVGLRLPLRA